MIGLYCGDWNFLCDDQCWQDTDCGTCKFRFAIPFAILNINAAWDKVIVLPIYIYSCQIREGNLIDVRSCGLRVISWAVCCIDFKACLRSKSRQHGRGDE